MTVEWRDLGIDVSSMTKGTNKAVCPKCNHKRKHKGRKSLTVNIEEGNNWFKCWNDDCDFQGSLEQENKYAKVKEKARIPESKDKCKYSKDFAKHWEKRGISTDTLKELYVYERSQSKQTFSCYPYFRNYCLVNTKFVSLDKKKSFQISKSDGAELCFWNFDNIGADTIEVDGKERKYVIITEGEPSAVALVEAGFKSTIGVPSGAPDKNAKNFESHFSYIDDHFRAKIEEQEIDLFILATDDDEVGVKLREELARRIGKKERTKIVKYPKGCKDPDDLLKDDKGLSDIPLSERKEKLRQLILNSKYYPLEGIIRVGDMSRAELSLAYNNGFTKGLVAGWREVDRIYSVKRKHMSIWTGNSGSGKTEMLFSYLVKLIKNNPNENIKIGVFSPESRPASRLVAKIAAIYMNKPVKNIPGKMSEDEYWRACNWVHKHFFIIKPPNKKGKGWRKSKSLGGILEYEKVLVEQEGIFGCVIDPWNKLNHVREKGQSEKDYITESLDTLLEYNEIHDIHRWIIAHPTKMHVDPVSGNEKEPFLSDIAGAAEWKTMADLGVCLHRNYYEKIGDQWTMNLKLPTIWKTRKVKFEELGEMGTAELYYDKWGGGNFVPDQSKLTPQPTRDKNLFDERQGGGDIEDEVPF